MSDLVPLARVREVADERDVFYPPKFEPTPSQNYVRGWRDLQRKLRTVLDEDGAQ